MLITKMLRAGALSPMQREAVRLLRLIVEGLDVTTLPDGSIRFTFESDVAFLDRLGIWGAQYEDIELTDDDVEADEDLEDEDGREGLKLLQELLPSRDVRADLDPLADGMQRAFPLEALPEVLTEMAEQIAEPTPAALAA